VSPERSASVIVCICLTILHRAVLPHTQQRVSVTIQRDQTVIGGDFCKTRQSARVHGSIGERDTLERLFSSQGNSHRLTPKCLTRPTLVTCPPCLVFVHLTSPFNYTGLLVRGKKWINHWALLIQTVFKRFISQLSSSPPQNGALTMIKRNWVCLWTILLVSEWFILLKKCGKRYRVSLQVYIVYCLRVFRCGNFEGTTQIGDFGSRTQSRTYYYEGSPNSN